MDNQYKDTNLEYISQTQTLVGSKKKRLVDLDTGEEIYVDQVTKRVYGTKNFIKVYLADLLQMLGLLESKPLDVLCYIIENTNTSNNIFIGTYKQIAKDTGTSEPTIAKVMKKLQEGKYIKKVQNGVYFISPSVMVKGNDFKQRNLIIQYEEEKPIEAINKPKKGIKRQEKPLLSEGIENTPDNEENNTETK
jgi:DNA-binding transcriptional regulator YhcF (GntR family)